ncbi:MAG: thioredoxin family protein [Betaproteobacteria bacterium HGW-Betaproteobacteria-22]|nr:MAG: thioredoxin family protein [Betaproteobacteria bacterium HGW-Betaproteobacteria-22]
MALKFYTTSHCHLCERAEALLHRIAKEYDMQWNKLDIANDESMIEQYGTIIPVIQRTDNNTEIKWPFTYDELLTFICS